MVCRKDPNYVAYKGRRGCFHLEGNSSLCHHMRQHWPIYKKTCEKKGLVIRDAAMLEKLLKQQNTAAAAAEAGKNLEAGKLISMGFSQAVGPREFFVEGALEHISKYIVCTDQVCVELKYTVTHLIPVQFFATAKNIHFRNQLVVFCSKTHISELPTAYKIKNYVHNFYVAMLEELRVEIEVSLSCSVYLNRYSSIHSASLKQYPQLVMDGLQSTISKTSLAWMNSISVWWRKKWGSLVDLLSMQSSIFDAFSARTTVKILGSYSWILSSDVVLWILTVKFSRWVYEWCRCLASLTWLLF